MKNIYEKLSMHTPTLHEQMTYECGSKIRHIISDVLLYRIHSCIRLPLHLKLNILTENP